MTGDSDYNSMQAYSLFGYQEIRNTYVFGQIYNTVLAKFMIKYIVQ